MIVEGFRFDHVTDIEPARRADGSIQSYLPQDRYANMRKLALHKYGAGPFCKFRVRSCYRKNGVYLLVIGTDVQYVGECANLSARFNAGHGNISPKNCYKGGRETNCRVNNLIYTTVSSGKRLALLFHETPDYKAVEARLRALLRPPWNLV